MRRRTFIAALGCAAAGRPFATRAQPNGRIRVIGLLYPPSEADDRHNGYSAALREGLRDLGYVIGENLRIEARYADGQIDRLKPLAAELVGLNVELILSTANGVTAAHAVTTTVPIVAITWGDLVAAGLAESLAHPGGNVTGFTIFYGEMPSKRLELLKRARPSMTRAGLLLQGRSDAAGNRILLDLVNRAAANLKVELVPIAVASAAEVERALSDPPGGPVDGFVFADTMLLGDSAVIADIAVKRGLPSIGAPLYASAGGLLGYGLDFPPFWRRAATLVDKILKGAKPGDIPIDQATTFKTTVNLKTAKALGVEFPPMLLSSVDEVIE
jgi:putative ABC transport system substrate-binding protein